MRRGLNIDLSRFVRPVVQGGQKPLLDATFPSIIGTSGKQLCLVVLMPRKCRHYETLGFLLKQLGAQWARTLPLVGLFIGTMCVASPNEAVVLRQFILPFLLSLVSITSLIIVFRWLTGQYRRQARRKLIYHRRRAQGRRKLSLELGLPLLPKKAPIPIGSRSFQSALTQYLHSIFTNETDQDSQPATSQVWLSPDLTLKKVLPRSAKRLRYLLERIRSLVHPNAN